MYPGNSLHGIYTHILHNYFASGRFKVADPTTYTFLDMEGNRRTSWIQWKHAKLTVCETDTASLCCTGVIAVLNNRISILSKLGGGKKKTMESPCKFLNNLHQNNFIFQYTVKRSIHE